MAPSKDLRNRSRNDYPFMLEYRTRWNDNDMYDHMNNSVYNFLFDSVINSYLMDHCGLHPPTSAQHPLMASTHCDYFAAISYPKVAELCLRVNKLGKSSVVYEIALFEKDVEQVKAIGEFVHVFVDRETQRPNTNGMNTQLRQGLQKLLVEYPDSSKL
ncbi:Thioesterase/thiol ester dehydrase-isomerase [Hypoxylon fragiforme]|uniref:Thioesterase/thiol ester dehydrase-isomerase n=1 Tax=Hypoxylon fragiforme TaxID=63214 RepID=UPI0020C60C14|nr:Thioesterase/thiol ester dehydrase-isomerase [Hypoxylon fragiforme]KAI2606373.1 Thioesterase/thiol ester dehydrase-isomerase [Hypoxylon fragiforme]